jgi:ribosomal protein S18 acetylase RimI-like enzyme
MAMTIASAPEEDPEWCARLMVGSDPWSTLSRNLEQYRAKCRQTEYELFLARRGDEPCGFILLDPRGAAGSPYISTVAVAPEWRGREFGQRLVPR